MIRWEICVKNNKQEYYNKVKTKLVESKSVLFSFYALLGIAILCFAIFPFPFNYLIGMIIIYCEVIVPQKFLRVRS